MNEQIHLLIILSFLLICFHQTASVINAAEWEEWKSHGFLLKVLARKQPVTGENVVSCTASLVSYSMILTHPSCVQNKTSGERYAQIAISLPNFYEGQDQLWATAKVLEVNEDESWAILRFVPQNHSFNDICPLSPATKWVIPLNYPHLPQDSSEPAVPNPTTISPMKMTINLFSDGIMMEKCFLLGFETMENTNNFHIVKKIGSIFFKQQNATFKNEQFHNVSMDLHKADNASGCYENIGAPLLCKHSNGRTYQIGMFQSIIVPQRQQTKTLQDCAGSIGIRFTLLPSNIFDIVKRHAWREVDAVYNLCNFYQNNVIGEEESLPDAPLSGLKTEMENSPNEQTSETKKATVAPAGIKTSMASTEPCGVILESTKRKREIQNEPSFRIEHGQQTHEDDYPFIAYVAARCTMEGKLGKLQHCTGTIIQRRWILTAAHCTFKNATELAKTYKCSDFPGIETTIDRVEGSHKWMYKLPAMNMFVSVGSKYDPENPNWLSVKSVIRHDAYKSDSDAHDIALLELENPLDFGPKINRICLARAFEPVAGDNAMIMGFGITKGPVENANKINEDKNHLREDTIRFKTVGCPAGFFCQNHPLRKTTHGDSGGPVVRTKANSGSWYEIALVRGHSDQNVALPNLNLFTRIGPHCDWIAKNTRSECQCGSM